MDEPAVRVGVLGPVVVWPRDTDLPPLAPPTTLRSLLAALALNEEPATAARLLDVLRDEELPRSGRTWVHVVVNRLRSWLRANVGDAVRVESVANGYRLALTNAVTDVDRFGQLTADGMSASPAAQQCTLLTAALELWRGPVAADAADQVQRCEPAQRLDRGRILAAERLADAALQCGRAADAVPHVAAVTAQHPFHERLHSRHALLLAAAGEQYAAFDVIHRLIRRLAEELGVDPGEDLRQAHQQLLQHEVGGGDQIRRAYSTTWRGPRCHLDQLIGRDHERSTLLGLLAQHRLVTITGTGGCGKTTLALWVAEDLAPHYSDGIAVLGLAAVSSPDDVFAALGELLRVRSFDGKTLDAVQQQLAGKRMLLVVDNCEHLAEACAALVRRLLGSCTDLTVLTTSRQSLGVPGEVVWHLEPLAVPEESADRESPSVALFLTRAKETTPSRTLAGPEDRALVAAICRLLDGLPLAIELAAAQLRVLDVTELYKRLRHGMELLGRATSGGDPRHRTMTAAIDWSYRLLDKTERRLFCRLGGFVDGFGIADAEWVCGFAPLRRAQVAPLLASLVERSLVQPEDGRPGRYRMLQPISTYAADRLAASREDTTIADRQLAWLLDRARDLDAMPYYRDRVAAARELVPDSANIRSALEHAYAGDRTDDAAELTARLFEFWLTHRSHLAEGERWLDRALMSTATTDEVATLLRFHQAMLRALHGDYLGNLDRITDLIDDLARHRPREHLEAQANLLTIRCSLLDPAALSDAAGAVESVRTSRYPGAGTVLTAAGTVFRTWGRYAEAADACDRFTRVPALVDRPASAVHRALRIEVALGCDDVAAAKALAEDLLHHLDGISNPSEQDPPRRAIALTYLTAGESVRAREFLTVAIGWMRTAYPELGGRLASLWILLAEAQRQEGDLSAAVAALANGLGANLGGSAFRHALPGVLEAALLAAALGDDEAATTISRRWETLRRRLGLPVPLGFTDAAAVLDLDPDPPPRPRSDHLWDGAELDRLITDAHTWCVSARSTSS